MVDIKIEDADQDTIVNTETNSDEDKIRFTTKGVLDMIIDDSGNVGIGTTSVNTGVLEIHGGNQNGALIFDIGGTNYFRMGIDILDPYLTDPFKIGSGTLNNASTSINTNKHVGFGYSDSIAKLSSAGIKIVDGNQGDGKVLTSDSSGLARWETNHNYIQPAGVIAEFAGSGEPAGGWLLCDGRSIGDSSSGADITGDEYEELFNIIQDNYGGDASPVWSDHDKIYLPNLKGRIPVGLDSSQTEFDSLGETGGSKTHTLTVAELAVHSHSRGAGGANGGALTNASSAQYSLGWDHGAGVTGTTQPGGSSDPHNNLQPYITINYIIKY